MLEFSTARIIVMPAYDFHERMLFADQISGLQRAAAGPQAPLLVFTSPRSVEFGLGQVPPDVLAGAQVAAIGPSTARLLEASGICVNIRPQRGYTSEDLLESLSRQEKANGRQPRPAFILTAPGGRTTLKEGLLAQGYEPHMLMVYESRSTELLPAAVAAIENAATLLAVWTSANTMHALSQRLPASCWSRLCRADWLVISERLQRLARAYKPAHIHLAAGPANADIAAAVKAL
jgi:uroporphyrinogen-III synthase